MPEHVLDGVHEHIKSFKVIPSHNCRKTTDRKYLTSELNIKCMYRMYVDFCADKGYSTVKESRYRRVFNTCYNLSFHARKKDKCNYCAAYENSTKQMGHSI